jgi:hypothetical protein
MHVLTAWNLKFQVCLRYTFTPATFQEWDKLSKAKNKKILSVAPQSEKAKKIGSKFEKKLDRDKNTLAYFPHRERRRKKKFL